MSGIFLHHFPLCLNPEGPQDVFWLLPLSVRGPGVLGEGENFCSSAGPQDRPALAPRLRGSISPGTERSLKILKQPIPEVPGPDAIALWLGLLIWGERAQLGPILVWKFRVFSTTAHP